MGSLKAEAAQVAANEEERRKNTKKISQRWLLNSLGMTVLVLVAIIVATSLMVRSNTYGSIQTAIDSRSEELTNVFANNGLRTSSAFSTAARQYVENFPNKESMELMVFNAHGDIINTSLGFAPDGSEDMPDYTMAIQDKKGYGTWTGYLSSGEKVMAVTRVLRSDSGKSVGAIRYVVSLSNADRQILVVVLLLILVGLIVIALVLLSGRYFIRSILGPIRQISSTAKRIAQGDFQARIENYQDDEIGDLCRTINDMAKELGTTERMKNDFISSVSHELRTPLTAIKGWGETLQSGGLDQESFNKGMDVILKETERLSGMVEELLDFSRMQSGRMTLTMDRIDILAELGEAVYMFSERAKNEGKFLLYEEPAMLSPVLGDVNRLRQVFVNILDNALKYTDRGGTINVAATEAEGFIQVAISDNGCGIPAKHLPNVKKKFYKANQTVRGSGIGLALADEIMRLHSGSLDIESQEGVGTVVTITIPTIQKLRDHLQEEHNKQSQEERDADDSTET
ncbi:MAG: HAMP domain-containing histidine kinase [Oscillospiraceae bacterium]|jgi:signal transduction histidine kinase|nr:HAMP domain-containing histidine kinase [Oscillospiraceae bacterium]MDD3261678.1 HAMP domain-containing sensor histidine kinase [Oscillospiraceae bacterium]